MNNPEIKIKLKFDTIEVELSIEEARNLSNYLNNLFNNTYQTLPTKPPRIREPVFPNGIPPAIFCGSEQTRVLKGTSSYSYDVMRLRDGTERSY
jgi:hypothetical protein